MISKAPTVHAALPASALQAADSTLDPSLHYTLDTMMRR
jgi:hypothetical protein